MKLQPSTCRVRIQFTNITGYFNRNLKFSSKPYNSAHLVANRGLPKTQTVHPLFRMNTVYVSFRTTRVDSQY